MNEKNLEKNKLMNKKKQILKLKCENKPNMCFVFCFYYCLVLQG